MVVASVLMAMGMMMLSPLLFRLPFKIMLFVAGRRLGVDEWAPGGQLWPLGVRCAECCEAL